ncbi:MAG: uracil-DNA glycosylase [Bacteroidales bacterium]|nr:uracil-DNA glycosylase [Bacteroidales bacterium]
MNVVKYDSVFLDSLQTIDSTWIDFLTPQNLKLIRSIEKQIIQKGEDYTPATNRVFHFFTLPLNKVKIVILGQDPYPQKGVATGRAFEVGTLRSWHDTFNNISLKNIIRSIYYAYHHQYLKYNEIIEKPEHTFHLKPPHKLFKQWEKQGVLLLNTSFTCETGKPNSHEQLWYPFTQKLLRYIHQKNDGFIWFIWGNNAKSITNGMEINHKIESMHPMMCYNKPGRDTDFLFGKVNPFIETKNVINWLG